jgi:hypothetical protein
VKALRLEAVRLNRAGDREGARAALRRAKAARARAGEAERSERTDAAKTSGRSSSERRTTDHDDHDRDDDAFLETPGVLNDLDPRASAHLEALMASARSEMTRLARSEDPENGDGERALSSDESGDARLLSDALGADHDDAHFSGAYDGRAADGTTRDVDAGALALERCAELEGEIREMKKRASAATRAGETGAARAFLEAAEAMREELRETRAFAEDEAEA